MTRNQKIETDSYDLHQFDEKGFPKLTNEKQTEVDVAGQPFPFGSRVFALFEGSYYPAMILKSAVDFSSYNAKFLEDGSETRLPYNAFIPLADLKVGNKLTYFVDSTDKYVEIVETPSKDSCDEWFNAMFETKQAGEEDVRLPLHWSQLHIGPRQKKQFRSSKFKYSAADVSRIRIRPVNHSKKDSQIPRTTHVRPSKLKALDTLDNLIETPTKRKKDSITPKKVLVLENLSETPTKRKKDNVTPKKVLNDIVKQMSNQLAAKQTQLDADKNLPLNNLEPAVEHQEESFNDLSDQLIVNQELPSKESESVTEHQEEASNDLSGPSIVKQELVAKESESVVGHQKESFNDSSNQLVVKQELVAKEPEREGLMLEDPFFDYKSDYSSESNISMEDKSEVPNEESLSFDDSYDQLKIDASMQFNFSTNSEPLSVNNPRNQNETDASIQANFSTNSEPLSVNNLHDQVETDASMQGNFSTNSEHQIDLSMQKPVSANKEPLMKSSDSMPCFENPFLQNPINVALLESNSSQTITERDEKIQMQQLDVLTDLELANHFGRQAWQLYNRNQLNFCTLKFKDKSIMVPAICLTARSDTFKHMLLSNDNIIKLENCGAEKAFMVFVEYLFCGSCKKLKENVIDLLTLANEFKFDRLKSDCLQIIHSSINNDSLFSYLQMAVENENIKQLVLDFVKKTASSDLASTLFTNSQWFSFSATNVELAKEISTTLLSSLFVK